MLPSLGNGGLRFALEVFLFQGLAFVMEFLSLAEAQFHFCPARLPVKAQRDQGQALLLDSSKETIDFPPVEEQFPAPLRDVVEHSCGSVMPDMAVAEKCFPVLDAGVAVFEVTLPLAE